MEQKAFTMPSEEELEKEIDEVELEHKKIIADRIYRIIHMRNLREQRQNGLQNTPPSTNSQQHMES